MCSKFEAQQEDKWTPNYRRAVTGFQGRSELTCPNDSEQIRRLQRHDPTRLWAGQPFYNASPLTFARLLGDAPNIAASNQVMRYVFEAASWTPTVTSISLPKSVGNVRVQRCVVTRRGQRSGLRLLRGTSGTQGG
jgi:hypothetical protein